MDRRRWIANGVLAAGGLMLDQFSGSASARGMESQKDIAGRSGTAAGAGSLKVHAAARGLLAGSAVDVDALRTDAVYRQLLIDQCSVVVGENCMKFQAVQPGPGVFDFTGADVLLAFAEANGMKLRGHNFIWHEALPGWFAGTVTRDNARAVMTGHIQALAGRYKGKVHSWDVVNEAVWMQDGRPDGLRTASPWFELLGPEYLATAFRTAREADPAALLTYNEYGIEGDSPEETAKRAAVLALLRKLKAAGVPVDALGLQSHLAAGQVSSWARGTAELVEGARQLGLQVLVTEMDVKDDPIASDDVAVRDGAVAEVYGRYLAGLLRSPVVKAVLTWGMADNRTWLNHGTEFRKQHPTRSQRPLPFDAAYRPKPAFDAIRNTCDTAPSR